MRHDQLANTDSFDIVEPSVFRSETAVPDMPASVGFLLGAVYFTLIGFLAVTVANQGKGPLVIAVDLFFLAAFLTVPALLLKVERDPVGRPDLSQFLRSGIQTHTGHISGAGALAQMFVVPVLLAFGVLAIGIIAVAAA